MEKMKSGDSSVDSQFLRPSVLRALHRSDHRWHAAWEEPSFAVMLLESLRGCLILLLVLPRRYDEKRSLSET
jgi:hypothetical protein